MNANSAQHKRLKLIGAAVLFCFVRFGKLDKTVVLQVLIH